jgi:uncharacterized RDD family membrane protein YckC
MPRRLGARMLDSLILGFIGLIVIAVIVGAVAAGGGLENIEFDDQTGEMINGEGLIAAIYAGLGLLIVVNLGYEIALIALRGATLGKQIVGIKVVREQDGQPPGWGPSLLRFLIPLVGSFACGIGQILVYLSPFFDSTGRNQGWQDKAASTVVIRS